MMAGLRPYPTYRDSGVPWLGEVPRHWSVRRLGTVTSVVNGATPASGTPEYWDGDIPWITPEDLGRLSGRRITDTDRKITSDGYRSCGTRLAPKGSIAISTRAPIGHMAILDAEACANQGCRLLAPRKPIVSEYLYFALTSARAELATLGQGTTFPELSRARLRAFPLPAPCLQEQAAIARFLDDADRRIQRAITAKEKRMALLEEQRQATVHQAVTGQIDIRTGEPYPAYKDSGVSWIGDVPEHWPIVRLGRLFERRQESGLIDLPILEVSLKTGVRVREFSGSHRKQVMDDRTGYQRAIRGDIAYNMMRMWQGAVGVVPEDGLVSPAYVVARPTSIADARYFTSLFRTAGFRRGIDMNSRGIVKDRNRLYWQDFKQLPAPCPPSDEQRAIVEHLEEATAKTRAAVEGARRQVELAGEYRARLIADVVTGKLDVREAAAALPEKPPE